MTLEVQEKSFICRLSVDTGYHTIAAAQENFLIIRKQLLAIFTTRLDFRHYCCFVGDLYYPILCCLHHLRSSFYEYFHCLRHLGVNVLHKTDNSVITFFTYVGRAHDSASCRILIPRFHSLRLGSWHPFWRRGENGLHCMTRAFLQKPE